MKVYFWGSRGSLPASVNAEMVERKLFEAVSASRTQPLESDEAVREFIRKKIPFSVRGSYGGNTSCVEIKGADDYVLCDAGTGLRDFGNYYMKAAAKKEDSSKVFHILISHPHWDHIQGFPFFVPAYVPGHHVRIYGCHDDLEDAFIKQQSPPFFPVPLQAMQADISFHSLKPGITYDIAGMKVLTIEQNHPGRSYGYRFSYGGKVIVYSTDAEHAEDSLEEQSRFVDFSRGADVLIFDAQYNFLETIDMKENWGHSSNIKAVEMAVDAGVKKLCLFHSEHSCNDENLDRFLNDTRDYLAIHADSSPLQIFLAYDGLELDA
jgi:phosphoribosyl 1,2-cyclic phosphodiesterase